MEYRVCEIKVCGLAFNDSTHHASRAHRQLQLGLGLTFCKFRIPDLDDFKLRPTYKSGEVWWWEKRFPWRLIPRKVSPHLCPA